MASGVYNRFKANLMNKEVDLEGDVIKCMLLDSNHAFSATNSVIGDVNSNELANGNGYTTGGETLANKSVTQAAATKFDADNVEWTSASFTAAHAVLWDDSVGTDDLICSIDFGGDKVVSSGTFTIQWHEDGILTLS